MKNVISLKPRQWWKEERASSTSLVIGKSIKASQRYSSVKELASRFSCGVDYWYDAIRQGKLQCQPLGRTYRISEEALEAFLLNERKRKSG